jgi:hypothetical protein
MGGEGFGGVALGARGGSADDMGSRGAGGETGVSAESEVVAGACFVGSFGGAATAGAVLSKGAIAA